MPQQVLKSILSSSKLFAKAWWAEQLMPEDFPGIPISNNAEVEGLCESIGIVNMNRNDREESKPVDTTEKRTLLGPGNLSEADAAMYCDALAKRVGEVQKPIYKADSGIRSQTVVPPMRSPPKPTAELTEIPIPEMPPVEATPEPVAEQAEETQPPDEPQLELEQNPSPAEHENEEEEEEPPQKTSADGWISIAEKRKNENASAEISSSDDESVADDSLVSDDEDEDSGSASAADSLSEEAEEDEDSSDNENAEESEEDEIVMPAVDGDDDDDDDDEDSESSDEAPVQLQQEFVDVPKRKIPQRQARNAKRQKRYEEEFVDEDLVEDAHGNLVSRSKAKPKGKTFTKQRVEKATLNNASWSVRLPPPTQEVGAKRPAPSGATQPKAKRRVEPTVETLEYDALFNEVRMRNLDMHKHPLYAQFKYLFENMSWIAANSVLGDPNGAVVPPNKARFATFVMQKVAETIDDDTHEIHKAIYSCTKMSACKMPDGRYRIKFYDPGQETAQLYPHKQTVIYCNDALEYTAYTRAFYALRPARYVYNLVAKECEKTKRLPQVKSDPVKLYNHIKENARLLERAFIDWANMALLSRFKIFDD